MLRAETPDAPAGPLAGLRILDISTVVAGPFASALLADLDADVLKVEKPGTGDSLRALAPHKNGVPPSRVPGLRRHRRLVRRHRHPRPHGLFRPPRDGALSPRWVESAARSI